jgi:uncharacterized protein YbaP (TraB family)
MNLLFLRAVAAFVAAFIGVTGAWAADVPVNAKPAFWTLEHEGNRLYLLGSVHLLPAETVWLTEEIRAARDKSEVFVFEAPLKDADVTMGNFVEKHGRLLGDKTLRDLLGKPSHDALEQAAWEVQYPPRLLATVRPWLAAVYLELYAYLKLGYSQYYGVDHVLERQAQSRKASFAYLETVEEQLSYFLKLSPQEELRYLRSTVKDILEKPDMPQRLIKAWAEGDTRGLQQLIDEGMAEVPQLKMQLLTVRNRKWLPQVEKMVKSGKVHFVTVGAAHLVGREGVVEMLRAKGYKIAGP